LTKYLCKQVAVSSGPCSRPWRIEQEAHTNTRSIVGRTKDELRRSVIPGADVADVGFAGDEDLCAAKVAELEDTGGRVEEEILGLDVAVADANRMDVC
jgi:hypothetical protein